MKTNYIKPEIKVIATECESILAGSDTTMSGGSGSTGKGTYGTFSKGGIFDDDDWDE